MFAEVKDIPEDVNLRDGQLAKQVVEHRAPKCRNRLTLVMKIRPIFTVLCLCQLT